MILFLLFLNFNVSLDNEDEIIKNNIEVLKNHLNFQYTKNNDSFKIECLFYGHVHKKFLNKNIFFVSDKNKDTDVKDSYLGFFTTFSVSDFYTKDPRYSMLFKPELVRSVVELKVNGLTSLNIDNFEDKHLVESNITYCFAQNLANKGIDLKNMNFEYLKEKPKK